jgi:leucyl-tRNA synthetase
MELTNALHAARAAGLHSSAAYQEGVEAVLLMSAPVAPHLAEELWAIAGKPYSVHNQSWPQDDAEAARAEEFTLVVQVNGKTREKLVVPADIDEATARELVLNLDTVQRHLEDKTLRKVVYVPGRLINLVA